MNIAEMSLEDIELSNLNNVDNWILDKLNKTISSVNRNMENTNLPKLVMNFIILFE